MFSSWASWTTLTTSTARGICVCPCSSGRSRGSWSFFTHQTPHPGALMKKQTPYAFFITPTVFRATQKAARTTAPPLPPGTAALHAPPHPARASTEAGGTRRQPRLYRASLCAGELSGYLAQRGNRFERLRCAPGAQRLARQLHAVSQTAHALARQQGRSGVQADHICMRIV